MKIFILLSLLFSSVLSAAELKPEDLYGVWKVEQEIQEEGVSAEIDQVVLFHENGFIYTETLFHLLMGEEKVKVLSMGGPDLESWKIKEGKLITKAEKSQFDLTTSSLDEDTLRRIINGMNEEMKKPITSILKSKSADKLVLEDTSDNSISTYTRIKGDKYKKLLELKNKQEFEALFEAPKCIEEGEKDLIGEQMRRLSLSHLASEEFRAAPSLPLFSNRPEGVKSLRDRREILDRLLCAYLVNFWIILPEENLPSKNVLGLIKEFKLETQLTKDEKAILSLSRKDAQSEHFANVGWRMENMMALAWILGLEQCPNITDDLTGDDDAELLMPFIVKEIKALKAEKPIATIRTMREVAQLEDLFYCAHNAVRSAQLNLSRKEKVTTVPEGFHPMRNGGVISEKRHALTWALSPKVKWNDTDLSS